MNKPCIKESLWYVKPNNDDNQEINGKEWGRSKTWLYDWG